MSGRIYKNSLSDKEWEKLEKVWKEEGISVVLLSQRFGTSKSKIYRHLNKKFGVGVSFNKK